MMHKKAFVSRTVIVKHYSPRTGLEAWVKGVICNAGGVQTWHYVMKWLDCSLTASEQLWLPLWSLRAVCGCSLITLFTQCVPGHTEWPPTRICNTSGSKSSWVHGWCSKIKWIKHCTQFMPTIDIITRSRIFFFQILYNKITVTHISNLLISHFVKPLSVPS